MTTTDRRASAAAYHEAGHAAVAVRLGFQIESVEITPDREEQQGLCVHVRDHESLRNLRNGDQERVRESILILLAGTAAETRAGYGDSVCQGESQDASDALDLAFGLGEIGEEDSVEDFFAELSRQTEELLAEPGVWAAVEALAAELLRVGRVSGEQVHTICVAVGLPQQTVVASR